jgi:hypothetical protein
MKTIAKMMFSERHKEKMIGDLLQFEN